MCTGEEPLFRIEFQLDLNIHPMTGVSIVRPLYYRHPEADWAYEFENEYYFEENLLVHPVTDSIASDSLLVEQDVWLPGEGE